MDSLDYRPDVIGDVRDEPAEPPPPALPTLYPLGRRKAYYDELRALDARFGEALEAEARALKGERGITLDACLGLALRYRLKLAALVTLLEDRNVVAAGTYDRMKDANIRGEDGRYYRFAPMRLLADHIARKGLPAPAPGVEP